MLLSKETAESLCATRRSAGLPFMVQAFVTSEPKHNNHSALKKVIRDLLDIQLYIRGKFLYQTALLCYIQCIHVVMYLWIHTNSESEFHPPNIKLNLDVMVCYKFYEFSRYTSS